LLQSAFAAAAPSRSSSVRPEAAAHAGAGRGGRRRRPVSLGGTLKRGKRRTAAARPAARKRARRRDDSRRERHRGALLPKSAPPVAEPPVQAEAKQEPRGETGRDRSTGKTADPLELAAYEGGEQLLEQAVPHNVLLPEVSLRDVIAMGVERLLPLGTRLLDAAEVHAELEAAIQAGAPCSVVRLGDGELMTLSQDIVYPAEHTAAEAPFLPYAGVVPPDIAARDLLADAVRRATIVGVPLSRRKHFQPLLYPTLRGHRLDVRALRLTSSTINYSLYQEHLLQPLLRGKKLLLIGNSSPELAELLMADGYTVAGVIAPVRGFADIDRVIQEARTAAFDLALVAAGIPAVVIACRIAGELGKAALDFGHLADGIVANHLKL